jgi:hypothetical protein
MGRCPSSVTRRRRRPVSDRARICWQFSALIPPRWPRRGVQPSAGAPAGRPRTLRKLGPFTYKDKDSPARHPNSSRAAAAVISPACKRWESAPRKASPLQGAIPHAAGTQLAILPAGLPHISGFLFDLPLHHPQLATKVRKRSLGSGLRARAKNRRASLGWADEGVPLRGRENGRGVSFSRSD